MSSPPESGPGRDGPGAAKAHSPEELLERRLGRAWKRGLLLAAGIIVAGCVVFLTPLRELVRPEALDDVRAWVASLGLWGPLVFALTTAGLVALGASRLALATLAGGVFGWKLGTALALPATLAGCLITFSLVRKALRSGRRETSAGPPRRLARVARLLETHGVLTTTLVRVVPIGSCHAMNILMAMGPVRWRDFAWGTLFGIFPLTLSFALLGSGFSHGMLPQLLAAAVGIAALTGTAILAARRTHLVPPLDDARPSARP